MDAQQRAARLFAERFRAEAATLVRAPGRVNVIGEHTDYNDGFALPAAIDRELWIALEPRAGGSVELVSEGSDEPVTFAADDPGARRVRGWGAYPQGVAWALAQAGYPLAGWRGALASDIPAGAGLASSAALEVATARAFQAVSGFAWDATVMARAGQRAENEWVGTRSGVMDQMACALGRAGSALLIDCRALTATAVPLPAGTALVVLDTGTRRRLESSAYDDRRRDCEAAAGKLGLAALRDAAQADLDARAGVLGPRLHRRARHVVTENARTLATAEALRSGRPAEAGALLDAGHASLRDDFEVSSAALDAITAAARAADGCHGARMTGGGFAGCAVALVAHGALDAFATAVPAAYAAATGLRATVHVCATVDGASTVPARG